jgi:transcriptional regulator with XRE-family HTH domain
MSKESEVEKQLDAELKINEEFINNTQIDEQINNGITFIEEVFSPKTNAEIGELLINAFAQSIFTREEIAKVCGCSTSSFTYWVKGEHLNSYRVLADIFRFLNLDHEMLCRVKLSDNITDATDILESLRQQRMSYKYTQDQENAVIELAKDQKRDRSLNQDKVGRVEKIKNTVKKTCKKNSTNDANTDHLEQSMED